MNSHAKAIEYGWTAHILDIFVVENIQSAKEQSQYSFYSYIIKRVEGIGKIMSLQSIMKGSWVIVRG